MNKFLIVTLSICCLISVVSTIATAFYPMLAKGTTTGLGVFSVVIILITSITNSDMEK